MTDVEGSTRGWEEHGAVMGEVLIRQAELIAEAVESHGGLRPEEQGEGDSVFAVFQHASDGVAAAVESQRGIANEPWPQAIRVKVRMALHTGEALLRGSRNYGGLAVHKTARVRSLAVGGQVLVSSSTANLIAEHLDAVTLRDHGEQTLRDFRRPERIFQLLGDGLSDAPPKLEDRAFSAPLPTALTTFVGRSNEVREVQSMLASNRLVALTGTGGAGKTRLAIEASGAVGDRYDRVLWIDLAPIAANESVEHRVLAAIGGRQQIDRAPLELVVEHVGEARVLFVIDNCEHVVAATADFVGALLQSAPGAAVLATSREPIGLPGEVVYRVPPMSLPDGSTVDPVNAEQTDAVALFVQRARLVRPSFKLDDSTVGPVVDICRRLDALPLAIELSAARTRIMAPAAIAAALRDRFRLLGSASRGVTPRQQTLRASVDWSYDLLTSDEQEVLTELSAFAGSFPLSGAEAVVAGAARGDLLEHLENLVDKSLVQVDFDSDETRFRLLETIREYASERLEERGGESAVRDRHLRWCTDLAEAASTGLDGSASVEWVARLDLEEPNIKAALHWAALRPDPERLWSMYGALTLWWASSGSFLDSTRWFDGCLAVAEGVPVKDQLRARWGATHMAFYAGDFDRGGALGEETLRLARQVGDERFTARALSALGTVTMLGDSASADSHLLEAADLAARAGDDWCRADALQSIALIRLGRGDFDEALHFYDEALPLSRRLDNPQLLAWDRAGRALCAHRRGRLHEADALLTAGLEHAHRSNDPNIVSTLLAWQASIAAAFGEAAAWVEPLASALDRCLKVGAGQGALVVASDSIRVRLAAGDPEGAHNLADAWIDTVAQFAPSIVSTLASALTTAAAQYAGPEAARQRAELAQECARRTGTPPDEAFARLGISLAHLGMNDLDGAEREVALALAYFEAEPCPLELVDAYSLLGAIHASKGAHEDAATAWRAGDTIAAAHDIRWTPLRAWSATTRQHLHV